jgi:hypothetical protein
MILVYRPELESPPMDKECTITFSFVTGKGLPDSIQVSSGVNRNFPEDVWEKIKGYDVVKNLLNLNALRIEEDKDLVEAPPSEDPPVDSIANIALDKAMHLVEDSFDIEQLKRWDAKEERIRVKNAISKRITAITEGKG